MKGKDFLSRIMYFAPRILSILFASFLMLFALDTGSLFGFLIQSIPSLLVVAALIVAWRREFAGGWIFLIHFGLFTWYFETYSSVGSFFMISFPLFVIGMLFFYCHMKKDDTVREKTKRVHRKK